MHNTKSCLLVEMGSLWLFIWEWSQIPILLISPSQVAGLTVPFVDTLGKKRKSTYLINVRNERNDSNADFSEVTITEKCYERVYVNQLGN
jgi:hypothetical protein